MTSRIVLGTAQFGLDYGINNQKGKISEKEIFEILNYAYSQGIDTLDTAQVYGNSEKIIGNYSVASSHVFNIITKIGRINPVYARDIVVGSMKLLKKNRLIGVLIHDFSFLKENPSVWDQLTNLKTMGIIQKIGVSLYFPKELEYVLDHCKEIDIVQFPYNVFDRRFEIFFNVLIKLHIEIHIRSVFLQGVVFITNDKLPPFFNKFSKLMMLNQISENYNIPKIALCLCYPYLKKEINKVIIGIDSKENLLENIKALTLCAEVQGIIEQLNQLEEKDEKYIIPTNWRV